MATITAALVKDLREKTGAGMMDCKAALEANSGDIEAAIDWLRDAFGHLKAIGFNEAAQPLLDEAGVEPDDDMGVVQLDTRAGINGFIAAAKKHKIWDRDPLVRPQR